MPIYEYQCEKCHHHLEALQKITDKPLRECPECGKHALKRLLSAPLFRLAGSGWYETDFKSDKETKRNLAGKDEAPADSGKGATDKADAKPASTGKTTTTTVKTPPRPSASRAKPRPAAKKPAPGKAAKKRR